MTVFEHPIWSHVCPYAQMVEGRDNVDLLQLPNSLHSLAKEVVVNCISCGAVVHPFRARALSERSRLAGKPEERRLYYAPTCPSDVNPGCSRTTAARDHKSLVKHMLKVV